jgi:phosphatidylserine/phosphatidylglycerophosphate/cardiolipin synthase-like enzyme
VAGEDLESDLGQLAGRYFPPPLDTDTFVADSSWTPVVDGRQYFGELDEEFDKVGPGDTVLVSGLELNPYIDLCGRTENDPDYKPLGRQLVDAAARGAEVRLLIAGRVVASSIPRSGLPFRDNARHAELLREMRGVGNEPEPPLRGRVLIDFSSALLGSNHQKTVVIRRSGELTSYVSGIDLGDHRCDAGPHDRLRLEGNRWGWHDMAVRLRGPAARRVWDIFRERWQEALTLPDEHWLPSVRSRRLINPPGMLPAPPPAPPADPVQAEGVSVRVLRSTFRRKIDSRLPFRRRGWDLVPPGGHQEIFTTLVTAIGAARRYVYIEDQYLEESVGGDRAFELYPHLRAAAARGVKIVLVGSGTRDPDDIDFGGLDINRSLNGDLRDKLVDPLPPRTRNNVAVHRIESCTVHAKLVLIDDVFANIGSANLFSRSMVGADSEMSAAVVTTTSLVRDLRVAVWAEHLRTPVSGALRPALEDLDLALGIWRPQWLPAGRPATTWQRADQPTGFAPTERVITLVGPR